MIDNQQTGENLMILRVQKGLSQQGLAELCNVTHQAVSKWENGAALPDMQTLLFLSKYYGVTMEDILTGAISMDGSEDEKRPEVTETALAPAAEETRESADVPKSPPAVDWDQIAVLAPFASRETVERLILNQLDQENGESLPWETAARLIPFAGTEMVQRLLDRCADVEDAEGLCAIAPFVSPAYLETTVKKILAKEGGISLEAIAGIAPFLPREMIDRLILDYALKKSKWDLINVASEQI